MCPRPRPGMVHSPPQCQKSARKSARLRGPPPPLPHRRFRARFRRFLKTRTRGPGPGPGPPFRLPRHRVRPTPRLLLLECCELSTELLCFCVPRSTISEAIFCQMVWLTTVEADAAVLHGHSWLALLLLLLHEHVGSVLHSRGRHSHGLVLAELVWHAEERERCRGLL